MNILVYPLIPAWLVPPARADAAVAAVLAAEQVPQLNAFAQYGVLGIICALFLGFAFRAWRRETERADRLEAENRALNLAMQDKAIPALMAAATAMTEVTELLRDIQRGREYGQWRKDGS